MSKKMYSPNNSQILPKALLGALVIIVLLALAVLVNLSLHPELFNPDIARAIAQKLLAEAQALVIQNEYTKAANDLRLKSIAEWDNLWLNITDNAFTMLIKLIPTIAVIFSVGAVLKWLKLVEKLPEMLNSLGMGLSGKAFPKPQFASTRTHTYNFSVPVPEFESEPTALPLCVHQCSKEETKQHRLEYASAESQKQDIAAAECSKIRYFEQERRFDDESNISQ